MSFGLYIGKWPTGEKSSFDSFEYSLRNEYFPIKNVLVGYIKIAILFKQINYQLEIRFDGSDLHCLYLIQSWIVIQQEDLLTVFTELKIIAYIDKSASDSSNITTQLLVSLKCYSTHFTWV